MKTRIIIAPDGTLSAFIDEGTFEDGKIKLEKLIADLGGFGIDFAEIGQAEQHRHDDQHAALHATNQDHNH